MKDEEDSSDIESQYKELEAARRPQEKGKEPVRDPLSPARARVPTDKEHFARVTSSRTAILSSRADARSTRTYNADPCSSTSLPSRITNSASQRDMERVVSKSVTPLHFLHLNLSQ